MALIRTYQARLGRFHDTLRRKIITNQISLTGHATDCIRLQTVLSKQGDITSRKVIDSSVLPIVFPPLIDVPYRKLIRDMENNTFKLETLPAITDVFPFQIMCSTADTLYVGDLIFRIFLEPEVDTPFVMALEVKESLTTFGVNSSIWRKFNCTYSSETFPQELLTIIVDLAERRSLLAW